MSENNQTAKPYKNRNVLRTFCILLISSQLAFLLYTLLHLYRYGYLPPPFFYDVSDTFMDFFNVNFWSYADAPYEDWHAIYPIFTFFLGQLITPQQCQNVSGPHDLRECGGSSIWIIIVGAVIGALLCGQLAERHFQTKHRFIVFTIATLISIMSLPLLFAIERGNYIVLAFACLAAAELSGQNWKGAFWLAIAINFKPYIAILWFIPLIKRRYDYLIESVLFVLIINAVAFLMVGNDHYYLLFENILGFAKADSIGLLQQVYYTTSFGSWSKVLSSSQISLFFPPKVMVVIFLTVTSLRWAGLCLVAISLCRIIRSATVDSWEKLSLTMIMALLVVSPSPGGYALLFMFPFLPKLMAEDNSKLNMLLIFALLTPLDFIVGPTQKYIMASHFADNRITYSAGVTFLDYIRPFAVMLYLLSITRSLSITKNEEIITASKRCIN